MFSESKIHLIGIGGIGMSGVARILAAHSKTISGSDRAESPITNKLLEEDFAISIGEDTANIPADAELVIHTTAAKPAENLELLEANKRGLRVLSYPEALGEITKDKKVIAVTGAHGKSSTTGLLIAAARAAGEDISCLVGTNIAELDGQNARIGSSDWFILEACEYKRAFLQLSPTVLIVTNIEAEHLDYYHDLADYQSAFVELAKKLPADGTLITSSAEANIEPVIAAAPQLIDTADAPALQLAVPGEHNQRNAALALAAAELMRLNIEKAKQGMASYAGAWRRFEYKGELHGAPVIDDYAHHPTEIRATLQAARERYPSKRIVAVYQQHQLDRASKMLTELGQSFVQADIVLIPNIYAVRDEVGQTGITGADIAAEIAKNGTEALFTDGFQNTVDWLRREVTAQDAVLIMGAGDVWQITPELIS